MSLQPLLISALSAQQEATYRQGRLSNGLTYYIRHNAAEPGLASFYLAQRVGSILEMPHQRGISSIEGKILALYGRGMSQRDIASTVEDIYGFKMSHEQISHITDCILEEVNDWQRRPLKPCYPFVFVDCLYVSLRTERGVQQSAVHVILAYDTEGCKDVLGLWINEVESKHAWMQIFDELKARGLKEIGF